jgi:hypothetical protein
LYLLLLCSYTLLTHADKACFFLPGQRQRQDGHTDRPASGCRYTKGTKTILGRSFTPDNHQRKNANKQCARNNSDDHGSMHSELLSRASRVFSLT